MCHLFVEHCSVRCVIVSLMNIFFSFKAVSLVSVILIIVGCILKGRWGSYISSLVPRASVSVETGRDGKSSVDDWGCMHMTSPHEGGEIGDRLHDVGHRVMYFSKTKKRLHTLFHQWQIKSSMQGSYWFMVSVLVGLSKNSCRLFRSFCVSLTILVLFFWPSFPFQNLTLFQLIAMLKALMCEKSIEI